MVSRRDDSHQEMSMEEILASIRRYVSDDQAEKTPESRPHYASSRDSVTEERPSSQFLKSESEKTYPSTPNYEALPMNRSEMREPNASHFPPKKEPTYDPISQGSAFASAPSALEQSLHEAHMRQAPVVRLEPEHEILESTLEKLKSYVPGNRERDAPLLQKSKHKEFAAYEERRDASLQPDFGLKHPFANEPSAGSLDESVIEASSKAFSKLVSSVRGRKMQQQIYDYRGSVSLDDFVRELMTPIIKEWLQTHLQRIVEEMVEKEIQKITHGYIQK